MPRPGVDVNETVPPSEVMILGDHHLARRRAFTSTPGCGRPGSASRCDRCARCGPDRRGVPLVGSAGRRGKVLVIDDEGCRSLRPSAASSANDHEVEVGGQRPRGAGRHPRGHALRRNALQSDDGVEGGHGGPRGNPAHRSVAGAPHGVPHRRCVHAERAREYIESVPNQRIEKPFDLKGLRNLVNELIR